MTARLATDSTSQLFARSCALTLRDQNRVQDIAIHLLSEPWEQASNVRRITALKIAEDALTLAREVGL